MKTIVFTGFHGIEELLKKKNSYGTVYYSRSTRRILSIIDLAKRQGYPYVKVSEMEITKIAKEAAHRGIVFTDSSENSLNINQGHDRKISSDLDSYLENLNNPNALIIILDGITDPHNLGAIIRSSDQFYADLVLIPSRNSAKDNATVSKTSAGADNYVNIDVVTNLSRSMDKLKKAGFWIYGADMSGNNINKTDLTGRVVLVMGSEGKGLRDLIRSKCDNLVSIPTRGNVDSLNVSVAAGVMMYEVRRQQEFSS